MSGEVYVNGSPAVEGQELKYSDDVNSKKGSCILKFTKSSRLEDISGMDYSNIGTIALLHERMIEIKNGS